MAAPAAGGLVGKGRDISLAALQRHDSYINRIVDVASQVALYTFGHRANEWVRAHATGQCRPGLERNGVLPGFPAGEGGHASDGGGRACGQSCAD